MFSKSFYQEVEKLFLQYPKKVHALLPILWLIQREQGYVSSEAMKETAMLCEVPVTHVEGVVTFYTMYAREPRGKCYLGVCTNVACMIRGGEKILEHIQEKLGIHSGESSEDMRFYLEEVECLGACGSAPVMLVGEDYRENLSVEEVDRILDSNEHTK